MKHFFIAVICAAAAVLSISGCAVNVDYTRYITESRSEIYIYSDDDTNIKIYCVSREQPYCADGICGNLCNLREIFITFTKTPESVEIIIDGFTAEMNYEAVEKQFTLNYSAAALNADGVDISLICDGIQKNYRVLNVKDNGVISCEQAVKCAAEYDAELFKNLTTRRDFKGEIYVRLLYDEGCYYYVGVCDRDKNITAYLLDGGIGKVITSKKITTQN